MAEKENSAFRLYRFVQKMMSQPDGTPTAQVLLNAFGADKNTGVRYQTATLSRVTSLLFSELDSLTEELSRAKFTDDSFQPIVTAFERLSVAGLANQWQHNKPFFHTSTILLRAFGEGLPEDCAPISKDDLTNLQDTIVELRDEVRKSDLPERVKIFVYEQIDTIARAIHDYPLAGVKAFRAAVRDVVFREAEHVEVVQPYSSTPVMTRLKAVVKKMGELSRYVIEFGKLLAADDSIQSHGEKAMHAAAQVAHQVSGVIHNLK